LSSVRAFIGVGGKTTYCVSSGNTDTQGAIFSVDGTPILEKYRDSCAKRIYHNRIQKIVYLTFTFIIIKGRYSDDLVYEDENRKRLVLKM
jgi:hypothetical protein